LTGFFHPDTAVLYKLFLIVLTGMLSGERSCGAGGGPVTGSVSEKRAGVEIVRRLKVKGKRRFCG